MEIDTLEKKSVKNLYAWLIAILPFVVSVPPAEYDNYVMVISFVIGLGLLVADRMNLTEAGYEPPSFLCGFFIPPVYLWKRATVLGSNDCCLSYGLLPLLHHFSCIASTQIQRLKKLLAL